MMIAHQHLDYLAAAAPHASPTYVERYAQAVHFDCGDRAELPKPKQLGPDVMDSRAPFPATLLQFTLDDVDNYSHLLIWFDQAEDGVCNFLASYKRRGASEWTNIGLRRVVPIGGGEYSFSRVGFPDFDACNDGQTIALFCLAKNFFYVLGCSNVATVDVPAPAPLNKKRAKKGAAPIQTYKTLHLVVPSVNGARANLGGTHNSPRVHLRRGHVRQLQDGRRIWVQACVVGAKHGVVHKDYAISYGVAA
jgi:hypothetical protein